ncbi:MAG TPA: thermonuclease family protein [Stellaceae bacterium]|nr:thermonuclease family protein [Stellaceae bacterium]
MSKDASSTAANLALAIGVAAVAALAVAFAVPRHDAPRAVMPGKGVIYIPLPSYAVAAAPAVAALPDDALRSDEPFEPPAPPGVAASLAPRHRAGEQMAALTPLETAPAAAPPLDTVAIAPRETRPVPHSDTVARPAGVAGGGREVRARPPAKHGAPPSDILAPQPDEEGGVRLTGVAIVTSALELNVAGKPLRLFGIKAPASTDLCAPSAAYVARACLDASRQALAAKIGKDGEVTCHILATGGRDALPAVCRDADGTDLATWLASHGFALADPNDMVDYSQAETQAKTARSGLWSYR